MLNKNSSRLTENVSWYYFGYVEEIKSLALDWFGFCLNLRALTTNSVSSVTILWTIFVYIVTEEYFAKEMGYMELI